MAVMFPLATPFRILIVDDDADMCDALAEFFRQKGLTVTTAKDGAEAIKAIQGSAEPFEIVLTDLVMPQKSGLDVLRVAKEKFADVHVVLITGYASLETAIEAVRLGAYDYLTKPFKFSEIEILLKNIGERIGLLEQNRDMENKLRDLHDRLDSLNEGKSKVDRSIRGIEMSLTENGRKLDLLTEALADVRDMVKGMNDAVQRAARKPASTGNANGESDPNRSARSIRL